MLHIHASVDIQTRTVWRICSQQPGNNDTIL